MSELRDTKSVTDRALSALRSFRWPILAAMAVFGLGLYFRLWNIEHLFSIIHDYDEGAYALAGRFITEGYVPYRDFIMVHPPAYVYLLAAVYKVFGYSFFAGRYLSVVASMGSVAALFFAGRRLYGTARSGLVAAAFMAVETQMVYLGRRTVQESVGLLLISLALVFVADYLTSERRKSLIPAGVLLGVAVAVKYIMAPAALGVALGVAAVSLPESRWKSIRAAGRPLFLVVWGSISFVAYSLLMLLKWTGLSVLPVPFNDAMYPGPASWLSLLIVWVFPLLAALLVLAPRKLEVDTGALRSLVTSRPMWTVACFVLVGFFLVTAYFWATMPGEYLRQSVFLQGDRPAMEFPSMVAVVRTFGVGAYLGFLRMSMLPVLFVIPATILLLNRRDFSRSDCFLAVALMGGLVLCQWLYHLPRYYAALFPLMFLGISWMFPSLSAPLSARSKAGLAVMAAALVASVSVSAILLRNYTAFDVLWAEYATEEEDVYMETADYLRTIGAEKMYATSPAYPAMTEGIESAVEFDTFALLWLEKLPADRVVDGLRDEGVDYVLVDRWTRDWGPPYAEAIDDLVAEIRLNGELVHTVRPESVNRVEVYRMLPKRLTIGNGEFRFWETTDGQAHPVGWSPLQIADGDAEALVHSLALDEDTAVRLAVYEDGAGGQSATTHSGIRQHIPFPRGEVSLRVAPGLDTLSLGTEPHGPAIHFFDNEGHSVIVGFSSELVEEQIAVCSECGSVSVILPAPLHAWSDHSVNVAEYWRMAGWELPSDVELLVVLSANESHPGYYTFLVDSVTMPPGV